MTLRKDGAECRHCKTDRGPPYFGMSFRHVPNFVRNSYIYFCISTYYIPILQVNMFNLFYRFSWCFFSWSTCCFSLILDPPKNGWHSGDLALWFPSTVVGTLVCLAPVVANAPTRRQTGIRHTQPDLGHFSGCPEKTWNTALSHGEKKLTRFINWVDY